MREGCTLGTQRPSHPVAFSLILVQIHVGEETRDAVQTIILEFAVTEDQFSRESDVVDLKTRGRCLLRCKNDAKWGADLCKQTAQANHVLDLWRKLFDPWKVALEHSQVVVDGET